MFVCRLEKMMKKMVWCVLAVLMTAPMVSADDKAAGLPDGKDVVSNHLKAIGGVKAIRGHTSRYIKMQMEGMGQKIGMEMWSAAPSLFKMKQVMGPGMEVFAGFDGTIGWMINPMAGPMLIDGKQLDQMKMQADFYSDANKLKDYVTIETMEKADFEGSPCYKVRLVDNSDEESFEYYDVETGLLAGRNMKVDQGMGQMDVVIVESDYKQFDDMKIATKSVQKVMGMEMVVAVESVEFDKIDHSIFKLPEEIKKLVDDAKKAESDKSKTIAPDAAPKKE